jgi:amino acid transporter
MEILQTLAERREVVLLLICLMTASLGLFLEECMNPNMILRRYYLWLTYHWIKNWRKKDRWRRWLLKPLGLCVYCFSSWITIFFYLYNFDLDLNIFFALGMNYLWLKIIKNKIFSCN